MNILKRAFLILINSSKFKRIAIGCGLVSTGARVVDARHIAVGQGTSPWDRAHRRGTGHIAVGQGSFIRKNARIEYYNHTNGVGSISIGENNHFGWQCSLLTGERIEIGDDNLFASQILITDIVHGMNAGMTEPYYAQRATCKPVRIGNGNWIGEKASILPGVSIGDRWKSLK